jgi:hypothetical protein
MRRDVEWCGRIYTAYDFADMNMHVIKGSRDDLPHHPPMHIREAEIAAGVAVGELFVIEAEEVEDGGIPSWMPTSPLISGA